MDTNVSVTVFHCYAFYFGGEPVTLSVWLGDYKSVMQLLADSQKAALTQVLCLQIIVLAACGHNDCWCVSEEVEIKTHTHTHSQNKNSFSFLYDTETTSCLYLGTLDPISWSPCS